MMHLQHDLEKKENDLERLEADVQEHKGARQPSITTAELTP